MSGIPRVLHIHGSLARGDPQAERCARLIAAFGGRLRHTLVAADGDFGALGDLPTGVALERRTAFPVLSGLPLPGRLQRIARAMIDHHLVLTYGRAAIGAALAHTAFGEVHALPPLIHHEDGSDETPAQRRGLRSRWLRRLGLGKAAGLVVPTETMEYLALVDWQQPIGRVKRIHDGVDLASLGKANERESIPRLVKRPNEFWIGCEARFDGSDAPEALLDVLPSLDESWHLVVAGIGPARGAFQSRIAAGSIEHRVHLVSTLADPDTLVRLSDIVALAGGHEPLPRVAIAAMAAGKPLAGFDTPTAEVATCLAPDNAEYVFPQGEGKPMAAAFERLAGDGYLREAIGAANREKAVAERGEAAMIAAYRRLYASAMNHDTI